MDELLSALRFDFRIDSDDGSVVITHPPLVRPHRGEERMHFGGYVPSDRCEPSPAQMAAGDSTKSPNQSAIALCGMLSAVRYRPERT